MVMFHCHLETHSTSPLKMDAWRRFWIFLESHFFRWLAMVSLFKGTHGMTPHLQAWVCLNFKKNRYPVKPTKKKSMVKIFSCFKNISLLCCFRKASHTTKSLKKNTRNLQHKTTTTNLAGSPTWVSTSTPRRKSLGRKNQKKWRERIWRWNWSCFFNWLAQDMLMIGCIFGVHDWFHCWFHAWFWLFHAWFNLKCHHIFAFFPSTKILLNRAQMIRVDPNRFKV